MADTITRTEQVVLLAEFQDGDDRTIALDYASVDVEDASEMAALGAQVDALETKVKNKNLLIGDKAGADFVRFKDAKIVHKTVLTLDLNP